MEVQLPTTEKYGEASLLLYRLGGIFWTRPTRKLVIGPVQHEALVRAGLVKPQQPKAKGRGLTKTQT
jgi:hypothetical protein